MAPERYQDLLIDSNLYPVGKDNCLYILSPLGKMLVQIFFLPRETFMESFPDYISRLILMVYPAANIPKNTKIHRARKSKLLVMADIQSSESAYTYRLIIDDEAQTANMKLIDMPENGKLFITKTDLMGITKKMWSTQGLRNELLVKS